MAEKQKSRVLVVDDERNVLLTYRMLLEQEGYEATATLTAKEAIRLIEKQKFDILLCDLSLEEKRTGFESSTPRVNDTPASPRCYSPAMRAPKPPSTQEKMMWLFCINRSRSRNF